MSKLEFESIEECSKFLEGETFIYNDAECVVLSDAEECYVLGYKKAIEKACKLLKCKYDDIGLQWMRGVNVSDVIKDFRKAMEE